MNYFWDANAHADLVEGARLKSAYFQKKKFCMQAFISFGELFLILRQLRPEKPIRSLQNSKTFSKLYENMFGILFLNIFL